MATVAVGGAQLAASPVSQQLRMRQAQRTADQAEAEARALRRQASAAQQVADRAQENARDMKVRSDQADSRAGNARQALGSVQSLTDFSAGLQSLREGIAEGLTTLDGSAAKLAAAPVVNAEGQTTGTLINVTA